MLLTLFCLSLIVCAGEVEQLRLKQRIVDEKRREALSKILDIKGSSSENWRFMFDICIGILWNILRVDELHFSIQGALEYFVEFDRIC